MPVLSNIMLETWSDVDGTGYLRMTATDLAMAIMVDVPAEVQDHGAITVPGKLLNDTVTKFEGAEVRLSMEGLDKIHIKGSAQKMNAKCIPAEEFPTIPQTGAHFTTIDAAPWLDAAVFATTFASADIGRPVLTGVHVVFGESRIRFEAADGFKGGMVSLKHPTEFPENIGQRQYEFIIPSHSVVKMGRLFDDKKTLEFYLVGTGNLLVCQEGVACFTNLIDGRFPEIDRMVPINYDTRLIVHREDLLRAIEFGAIAAKDAQGVLRFRAQREDGDSTTGKLAISAQTNDAGVGVGQTIEVVMLGEQDENMIALNVEYIANVIAAFSTEYVSFSMQQATMPVAIREHAGSSDAVGIVMPMNPKN
jgi:DNA polymerase-3 subunit beta